MSIRIMSAVWSIALPDSEKLVLLALADCANDEGSCWPGMASLTAKCSKSERTIQGAIKSLCAKGHLTRIETLGKGCTYTVHPRKDCAPAEAAPPQPLPKTPAAAAPKPSGTVIPKKDKPSLVARKTRLPADFEPILTPAIVDMVRAWPAGMLERELAQFKDRNTAACQTYGDWQAAFRTWARNADKWRRDSGRSGTNGMGRHQPANDGASRNIDAAVAVFGYPVERSRPGSQAGDPRRLP